MPRRGRNAPKPTRRSEALKAALRRAGSDHEEFAARLGVTYQHLYAVVRGVRISPRLIEAVDAYIAKHRKVA